MRGETCTIIIAGGIDETTNRDVKDSILDAARSQGQWVKHGHGHMAIGTDVKYSSPTCMMIPLLKLHFRKVYTTLILSDILHVRLVI